MRFVTVARFERPYQAHLAAALLEDTGIPCTVSGEGLHGMTSFFSPRQGQVRLEVPEEHADEARAVLAEAEEGTQGEE